MDDLVAGYELHISPILGGADSKRNEQKRKRHLEAWCLSVEREKDLAKFPRPSLMYHLSLISSGFGHVSSTLLCPWESPQRRRLGTETTPCCRNSLTLACRKRRDMLISIAVCLDKLYRCRLKSGWGSPEPHGNIVFPIPRRPCKDARSRIKKLAAVLCSEISPHANADVQVNERSAVVKLTCGTRTVEVLPQYYSKLRTWHTGPDVHFHLEPWLKSDLKMTCFCLGHFPPERLAEQNQQVCQHTCFVISFWRMEPGSNQGRIFGTGEISSSSSSRQRRWESGGAPRYRIQSLERLGIRTGN